MEKNQIIKEIKNKWHNVYWFARIFINNDKYVPIGKQPKFLATLTSTLRVIARETKDKDVVKIQKQAIKNLINDKYKKTRTNRNKVDRLLEELDKEIETDIDIEVFIITCENIMIPLHQAIKNIPNNDREFTLSVAKSFLDTQGKEGLATIINLWDDLGVKGCLTAERTEIIRAFTTLRVLLAKDKDIEDEDKDIVLTAFVQEFERRAGQKRKKRAGGSLEDVTDFILDYYNIKRSEKPEHFQADIEVDSWIKTKDGWYIGISCKRTIRERWKQVSSAESTILSKHKILNIFHVVTYDEDLTDDKLVTLGAHRQIFYLPDNSYRLEHARNHPGLKDYVRPISQLIDDIEKLM